MYDDKTIFRYQIEKTLNNRGDLERYISNKGKYYNVAGREGIKLDDSLVPLFKAFVDISQQSLLDNSILTYQNHNLVKIMQEVGVFEGAGEMVIDSEAASVNLFFYSLEGFGVFVKNLADWLEKNDMNRRPTVDKRSE